MGEAVGLLVGAPVLGDAVGLLVGAPVGLVDAASADASKECWRKGSSRGREYRQYGSTRGTSTE